MRIIIITIIIILILIILVIINSLMVNTIWLGPSPSGSGSSSLSSLSLFREKSNIPILIYYYHSLISSSLARQPPLLRWNEWKPDGTIPAPLAHRSFSDYVGLPPTRGTSLLCTEVSVNKILRNYGPPRNRSSTP